MKIKQTIFAALSILVLTLGFIPNTFAEAGDMCGSTQLKAGQKCVDGVVTSVLDLDCSSDGSNIEDSCVWKMLITGINILSVGIGTLAVGGIVYGAFLYTTSDGNSGSTAKAIKTIQNVVFGLVAYAFMYSFLNFIIPGGIFN